MAFKMIANRQLYHPEESKEYMKGDPLTVMSETTRNRLLRSKRARMDDTAVAKPAPKRQAVEASRPPMVQKVLTADEPVAPAAPAPVRPAAKDPEATSGGITYTTDNNAPSGEINANKPNRYRRSDMRSED